MWHERQILIDNIYKVGMKGSSIYFQTFEGFREIQFENDEKAASTLRTILQLKEKIPSTFTEVPNSVFYEVSEKGINRSKWGFVSYECICCGYHSCGHGMCMASCLCMRRARILSAAEVCVSESLSLILPPPSL